MSSSTPSEEPQVAGIQVQQARDVMLRAGGDIVAGDKTTIHNYYGPKPQDITKAPYKFLSYYDIGDRDIFFGRDAVIEELAGEIPRHKVLIINGQSGSGKTSLINAGLIPRLAENGYLYVYFRDYTNPLEQLREYFRDHGDFALPDADKLSLLQILRTIRSQHESPVVVIFDQFERFLINVAAEPRREFLQQLRGCLESDLTADELNLVISLRDDFYGKLLLEAEAIIPTFGTDSHHHNLRTLNRDEARQAIIQPLKNIPDIGFDAKFVDEVLLPHLMGASGADGQSVQPETKIEPTHLQIVCNQLYEAARDRQHLEDGEPIRIGFDLYHDLGETEGMLRDYLDDVVRRITNGDPKQIAIVRSTLKLMIETVGTRKFRSTDDISANLPDTSTSEAEAIITKLQEARIVEAKQTGGITEFSLSHEFMVAKVESWYDEREIERKRAEETFERALKEWKSHNSVLDEAQLKLITDWLSVDTLGDDGQGLVLASKTRHRRQRWLKRGLLIALSTCAILMPIAAINWGVAQRETKKAIREQEKAERLAYSVAVTSLSALPAERLTTDQLDVAVAMAIEAVNHNADSQLAIRALANNSYRSHRTRRMFDFHHDAVTCVDTRGDLVLSGSKDDTILVCSIETGELRYRLTGHTGDVSCIAFLGESRAISGGADGRLIVWNLTSGTEAQNFDQGETITACVAAKDESFVVVGTESGKLSCWDLRSGERTNFTQSHPGHDAVNGIDLIEDSNRAISCCEDGTVLMWDVAEAAPINGIEAVDSNSTGRDKKIQGHTDGVTSIELLPIPRGTGFMTTCDDGEVRLWNWADSVKPSSRILGLNEAHSQNVTSLATHPDGFFAVTGGTDNQIIFWDLRRGGTIAHRFYAHRAPITALAFNSNPNVPQFVSGSEDGTVRVWDYTHPAAIASLYLQGLIPNHARFSSDDQRIFAVTTGGTIVLENEGNEWRLQTPIDSEKGLPISPAGRSFAMTSDGVGVVGESSGRYERRNMEGKVVAWNLQTSEILNEIQAHEPGQAINSIDISDDDARMLTGSKDNYVKLWDLKSWEALAEREFSRDVWAVVFLNNSAAVVGTEKFNNEKGDEPELAIWQQASYSFRLQHTFEGHDDAVYAIALNQDRRRMLSGSADRTAILWDLESREALQRFAGHTGPIRSVAFDPNGETVATGSEDGTVRIWNIETGLELFRFEGHTGLVTTVAFSHDGQTVVSGASLDLIVWRRLSLEKLVDWTKENRYVPEIPADVKELYGLK